MSTQPTPPPPPVPSSPPTTAGGVRRHHTISASSRTSRANAKEVIEEVPDQTPWNDDEPVDQDWVGGVGAVGEKTSLHRQSSLPTKYHRGQSDLSISFYLLPSAVPITDHPLHFKSPSALPPGRHIPQVFKDPQNQAMSPQKPSTASPPSQAMKATKNRGILLGDTQLKKKSSFSLIHHIQLCSYVVHLAPSYRTPPATRRQRCKRFCPFPSLCSSSYPFSAPCRQYPQARFPHLWNGR